VRSPRAISTKSRFRIIVRERQFSLSLSTLRSRPLQIWTRFYARVTRYRATAKSIHPLKIISSRGKNTTEACRMVLWRRFCSQLRSFARFRLHFSDSNSQKSLRETGLAFVCVSSLWVNQNRPLQQQRRDIFSRARTRPSGRKRHFFSIERDADRNAFDFPNLRRYVARRTTTSSGSKTSRKQSTSPVFRRTSSTRRAWCFLTNARIREVKTARVNGLRL
jgi:hypothetical protein